MMHRARHPGVALATILFFPAAGFAQQAEGLHLFFEAGARTSKAAKTLSSVLSRMPDVPGDLTDALENMEKIDAGAYPLTLRMYTPGKWDVQRSEKPFYFLATLDARGVVPVGEWLEELAAGNPGAASLVLRERRLHDGGRRYLIGDGWKDVRRELKKLHGDELPAPSPTQHGLLATVSQSTVYGFLDLSRVVAGSELRKLRMAGGRDGVMFALAANRSGQAWNLDIHWSTQPGKGMVGSFLPSRSEPCGLAELLPWKPGLVLQANPGSMLGRRLARMNIARMVPQDQGRALVEALLEVWEGPIGFYQPDPDDYDPPTIAPPTLQLSPEYIILIRVDPDSGDWIVGQLAGTMGPEAKRGAAGTFSLDTKHRSMHIGHRRGVIALCNTDSPETSAGYLDKVLEATEGGQRPSWRLDHELSGVAQMWFSPEVCRYLTERSEPHGPKLRLGGDWLIRMLAPDRGGTALGLSLLPDEHSLRLRVRF